MPKTSLKTYKFIFSFCSGIGGMFFLHQNTYIQFMHNDITNLFWLILNLLILFIWGWQYGLASFCSGIILEYFLMIGFTSFGYASVQLIILILVIMRFAWSKNIPKKEILNSEKKYRELFQISKIMIVELDQNNLILKMDKRSLEITGYVAFDVVGESFEDKFVSVDYIQQFRSHLHDVKMGKNISNYHIRIDIKGGFCREIVFDIVLHRNANSCEYSIILFGKDITELKVAQNQKKQNAIRLYHIFRTQYIFLNRHMQIAS